MEQTQYPAYHYLLLTSGFSVFMHLLSQHSLPTTVRVTVKAMMAAKPVLGRRFSRKQESSHTFQASIA